MPGSHAKLSPSSASRWISCPASIRMINEHTIPGQDDSSPYALEGTVAHGLAEIVGARDMGFLSPEAYAEELNSWKLGNPLPDAEAKFPEMLGYAEAYSRVVRELAEEHHAAVMFEQRVNSGVPGVWGTSDAIFMSPDHVGIVDFKYGMGVKVDAEGNTQLRLYACGALELLKDVLGDPQTVSLTVHQPRLGWVSTEVLSVAELLEWRDTVVAPAALRTQDPDAPFGPSEAACRFCPVAGICTAQAESALAEDFGAALDDDDEAFEAGFPPEPDPEVLTPEQVANLQRRVPQIKAWLTAFEAAALDMAYNRGVSVPGFKVVRSGGKRVWSDEEGALQALSRAGYDRDQVTRASMKTITDLTRLVGGKAAFDELVGDYLTKTAGRESLVPETDKRPAITRDNELESDFSDEGSG